MIYEILILIFFTVLGIILASFGNMLVFRLKHGESLLTRSHCEKCKHSLGVLDLVPVLSFFLLNGKCRYCKKKVSWREPIGEIVFALISAIWGYLYVTENIDLLEAVIYMGFTLSIFVIVVSDATYLELPDQMQIILALTGLVNILMHGNILWNLFNVAFAAGLLLFTFLLTGDKKMGFGDVKFAFGLGFFLNYFYFTMAILLSSIAGIVFAILVSRGDKEKLLKYRVPYASFLGAATVIILLVLVANNCDPLVFEKIFC